MRDCVERVGTRRDCGGRAVPCRGAAGALEARDDFDAFDAFDGFDGLDDGALRPCDRGAFDDFDELDELPVEGRWAGLAPRGGLPPRRGGREDGLIAALPA